MSILKFTNDGVLFEKQQTLLYELLIKLRQLYIDKTAPVVVVKTLFLNDGRYHDLVISLRDYDLTGNKSGYRNCLNFVQNVFSVFDEIQRQRQQIVLDDLIIGMKHISKQLKSNNNECSYPAGDPYENEFVDRFD